jgi:hypothetical protein
MRSLYFAASDIHLIEVSDVPKHLPSSGKLQLLFASQATIRTVLRIDQSIIFGRSACTAVLT